MATKVAKVNGGRIRKVTITEINNEEVKKYRNNKWFVTYF